MSATKWTAWLAVTWLVRCGGAADEEVMPPPDTCKLPALATPDGRCIRPGIPPDGCAPGFQHDDAYGCEPILPAEACGVSRMATVGSDVCAPVGSCGSGRWGDIPIDAATVFVDASYTGVGDGREESPWTSIGAAYAAARPGALIAIAGGSYHEELIISGKSVRLWGVCPDNVEIVGSGSPTAAVVFVQAGASATELHGLALRGGGAGLVVSGSTNVVADALWVHDNVGRGVDVEDTFGRASLTLSHSLVERNVWYGIYAQGASIAVAASVVRDTAPTNGGGDAGIYGITSFIGTRANVTVQGSLIERNAGIGVYVGASDANIEASVIRDGVPTASNTTGRGLETSAGAGTNEVALVTLRSSVIERNRDIGIALSGGHTTIERVVVRSTTSDATGALGRGISVQDHGPERATATLIQSLVQGNQGDGIVAMGVDATIDRLVARTNTSTAAGEDGAGIAVGGNAVSGAPGTGTVIDTLVHQNQEFGILALDGEARVDHCVVLDTQPNGSGLFGDGVAVARNVLDTRLILDASRVEGSARAGLGAFGASVSLAGNSLACNELALDVERYLDREASLEDRDGNRCGCPSADDACSAVSSGIAPPEPPQ